MPWPCPSPCTCSSASTSSTTPLSTSLINAPHTPAPSLPFPPFVPLRSPSACLPRRSAASLPSATCVTSSLSLSQPLRPPHATSCLPLSSPLLLPRVARSSPPLRASPPSSSSSSSSSSCRVRLPTLRGTSAGCCCCHSCVVRCCCCCCCCLVWWWLRSECRQEGACCKSAKPPRRRRALAQPVSAPRSHKCTGSRLLAEACWWTHVSTCSITLLTHTCTALASAASPHIATTPGLVACSLASHPFAPLSLRPPSGPSLPPPSPSCSTPQYSLHWRATQTPST